MAYLVPSLKAMFAEINAIWPDRDRTTDGWIGDAKHCPGTSDHCADTQGRVHAIDIDKDGIDPDHVVRRISNIEGVVRYINWNYQQYHVRDDFKPKPLGGDDPHTSHIHVSIEHTDYARNYTGGYGIGQPDNTPVVPIPELQITPEADWDSSPFVYEFGSILGGVGSDFDGFGNVIEQLRI